MNNVTTHPALWWCLCGDQGVQVTYCFADWVILAAVRLDPVKGSPWTRRTLAIYRGSTTNS